MTVGRGRKPSKGKSAKRTRFNLSRKGELALAAVGVLVVAVALFLLWSLLSPRLIPADTREVQKEREFAAKYQARWESLVSEGVVIKADRERQNLYVDSEKWGSLSPTGQRFAAASACAHHEWPRCFVFDPSGAQLGWYVEGDGYHSAPQGK